jgi:hypothetical protein
VDRDAQLRFLFHPNRHGLAILREVGSLSGHIKRVQQLFQASSSAFSTSRSAVAR